MATAFPRTLGQQQPAEPQFVDPYAAQIAAMQQRLAQPLQQQYTPEQVQQRQAENERQYQLGILGQLSGDQDAGQIGGQVLKQALAARAPKISERGTADQITGQFTYDPDYLRQRDQQAYDQLQQRSAGAQQQWQGQRAAAQDKKEAAAIRAQEQASLHGAMRSASEPLVQVIDPATGEPMYVRRSEAVGQKVPSKGGTPNGEERNAAGFASMMGQATQVLDKYEAQGRMTMANAAASAVPVVGNSVMLGMMNPAQQLYYQAAQQWVRAKLRKESGATIGDKEMADEIRTFFPQPNDGAPMREQKALARQLANKAMVTAAGRASLSTLDDAAPAGAPAGTPQRRATDQAGPALADPLGMRK